MRCASSVSEAEDAGLELPERIEALREQANAMQTCVDESRAAETPEALNAQLLARIAQLERELAKLQAKVDLARPTLSSVDEIARARRAVRDALVAQAAEPGEFLAVFDALVQAAGR